MELNIWEHFRRVILSDGSTWSSLHNETSERVSRHETLNANDQTSTFRNWFGKKVMHGMSKPVVAPQSRPQPRTM